MRATLTTLFLCSALLTTPVGASFQSGTSPDQATPTTIDYSAELNRNPAQQRYRERMAETLQHRATRQIAGQTAELLAGLGGVAQPVPVALTVEPAPLWTPVPVALRSQCAYPSQDPAAAIWSVLQTPLRPQLCDAGECVYL